MTCLLWSRSVPRLADINVYESSMLRFDEIYLTTGGPWLSEGTPQLWVGEVDHIIHQLWKADQFSELMSGWRTFAADHWQALFGEPHPIYSEA
jgi:hypothetical protein